MQVMRASTGCCSLCILYSMDYMNTRTGVYDYGCPSVLVFMPSSMKYDVQAKTKRLEASTKHMITMDVYYHDILLRILHYGGYLHSCSLSSLQDQALQVCVCLVHYGWRRFLVC